MSQKTLKDNELNEDAEFHENAADVFDEKALDGKEPGDNELAEDDLLS
ncbi:RNA polymerase sigma factor RpoS, partial [Erwinia amylovora]|nr:RNA polymerase sigma factor RpoS [Erwinia amylovora]